LCVITSFFSLRLPAQQNRANPQQGSSGTEAKRLQHQLCAGATAAGCSPGLRARSHSDRSASTVLLQRDTKPSNERLGSDSLRVGRTETVDKAGVPPWQIF